MRKPLIARTQVEIRSGAWIGDLPLMLEIPESWDLRVFRLNAPAPLGREEIWNALENPIGQPPVRLAARGCRRPMVVVDDLNRPTPAYEIVPLLLKQFTQAGIEARNVTVVMASGSHGVTSANALERKIGPEAASLCRLVPHDHLRDGVYVGKTSFGTPVFANRELLQGDFVVGVGGVFPNHTAGFGGGTKLALGVLGTRSIRHLHYSHRPCGWGNEHASDFRSDLDEIAKMVGMRTIVSVHIDADRNVVGLQCGDPEGYFDCAVELARRICTVPAPGNADVVIVNTYPVDLSVTFARMKGFAAFSLARPGASKVAIASCAEGLGNHNLFPLQPSRLHRLMEIAAQLGTLDLKEIAGKAKRRFAAMARSRSAPHPAGPGAVREWPVWVWQTAENARTIPADCLDMKIRNSWVQIIDAVQREQGTRHLNVVLYPCSPIQCFATQVERTSFGDVDSNPERPTLCR